MNLHEYIQTTFQSALPVSRLNMPQIDDIDLFSKYLSQNNISHYVGNVSPNYFLPTQQEFDIDKVSAIVKSKNLKTIIVSNDNYVLDGHHRFFAAIELDSNIDVLFVNQDILSLLKTAYTYNETVSKTV